MNLLGRREPLPDLLAWYPVEWEERGRRKKGDSLARYRKKAAKKGGATEEETEEKYEY